MAEEQKGGFDPDKLADALKAAADTYVRPVKSVKDKIAEPKVLASIRLMQDRGMISKDIAAVLAENGISITYQTLNRYLREIEDEAKGSADGKPERKQKTAKPNATAEAGKDRKTIQPEAGKQSSGATGSDSPGKPSSGLAEAARNAKSSGGASKPAKHPEKGQPDMGGVYDEKNF